MSLAGMGTRGALTAVASSAPRPVSPVRGTSVTPWRPTLGDMSRRTGLFAVAGDIATPSIPDRQYLCGKRADPPSGQRYCERRVPSALNWAVASICRNVSAWPAGTRTGVMSQSGRVSTGGRLRGGLPDRLRDHRPQPRGSALAGRPHRRVRFTVARARGQAMLTAANARGGRSHGRCIVRRVEPQGNAKRKTTWSISLSPTVGTPAIQATPCCIPRRRASAWNAGSH